MRRVQGVVVLEDEAREVLARSGFGTVDAGVWEVFVAEGCEGARCGWTDGVEG